MRRRSSLDEQYSDDLCFTEDCFPAEWLGRDGGERKGVGTGAGRGITYKLAL